MLQTFADLEAIEGFYLASANAAGHALFKLGGVQLPAFTKIEQGAVISSSCCKMLLLGSVKAGDTLASPAKCTVVETGGGCYR